MSVYPVIAEHVPLLLAVVLLLFLSAFFSASETAFFSLSRSTVSEMARRSKRERMVARILDDPRMLLVTILFGNLLVNISATSAVTALAIGIFGGRGVAISVAVMTFLILLFGEISPKSLALRDARSFAVTAAPLLRSLMLVFTPFRVVLGAVADYTVERSRKLLGERGEGFGAHELATAVEMGHREGLFGEFEKAVLTNLFLFSETTAREIVTPRHEVFALDVDTPLTEAIVKVRSRGHSRVPLFAGTSDTIVGILFAKDLLRFSRDDRVLLRDLMHPASFVPEGKRIRDLFGELITAHQHMAIAVDEHGAVTGLLTREDILEEIFGEIRNRREPRVEEYHRLGENRIVVEGTMSLKDVNGILGTDLESGDVETIAGYLVEKIGRIPRNGESFTVGDLRFLVLSAEPVRVNKLKIERTVEGEGKG
jgi:CBS domain containing-hemolysin-like protein